LDVAHIQRETELPEGQVAAILACRKSGWKPRLPMRKAAAAVGRSCMSIFRMRSPKDVAAPATTACG